jgi:uncharacterized protein YjhX (UPF0386 family)
MRRKKKNPPKDISEYRIKYSTKDGHSTGHWEAEGCHRALSCQIMALKNRKIKDAQIISVECFDRFAKKWIDHTPNLFEPIKKFNNKE